MKTKNTSFLTGIISSYSYNLPSVVASRIVEASKIIVHHKVDYLKLLYYELYVF